MPECNLTLPCSSTVESSTARAFFITNTQNGGAIQGNCPNGVGVSGGAFSPDGLAIGTGVQGSAQRGNGVLGTSVRAYGVVGSGGAAGVQGDSQSGFGVEGFSRYGSAGRFAITNDSFQLPNGNAALIATTASVGVAIEGVAVGRGGQAGFFHIKNSDNQHAALRVVAQKGAGIVATSIKGIGMVVLGGGGDAGLFAGSVNILGDLSATSKSFVIDHPLDPENKYLVHASVESSERANLYSGNSVLDEKGEARVELPAWVETLNTDFRYQLTCIGSFAPVYVAEEISSSCFKIAGGTAEMKVSWQLTGVRRDPWAQAHSFDVEQDKPAIERGSYRHPELFGQPSERSVHRMRHPELLQRPREIGEPVPMDTCASAPGRDAPRSSR